MTLKEITDLLGVRHNDAMKTVEAMTQNHEFGLATKIPYPIISGKGREQFIETYQLNKRQSIAVSARLKNVGFFSGCNSILVPSGTNKKHHFYRPAGNCSHLKKCYFGQLLSMIHRLTPG